MNRIFSFTFLLGLLSLLSVDAHGKPGKKEVNLLEQQNLNPGFESGLAKHVFTGSSTLTLNTSVYNDGEASGSWDPSATGEFYRTPDVEIVTGTSLSGEANCLARVVYSWPGTADEIKCRVELDDGTALTTDHSPGVTASGKWTTLDIPFSCPVADSVRAECESSANADAFIMDDWHIGSDIREVEVSQATTVLKLEYEENASGTCTYISAGTNFPELVSSNSGTCDAATIKYQSFDITNTADRDSPAAEFPYLPPGVYEVMLVGSPRSDTGSACDLTQAITDDAGSSYQGAQTMTNFGGAANDLLPLTSVGVFSYTEGGARKFEPVIGCNNGTGATEYELSANASVHRNLYWVIKRYPNDTETAIQKPSVQGWYVDANIGGGSADLGTSSASTETALSDSGLSLVQNSGSADVGIACGTTGAENAVGNTTCSTDDEHVGVVLQNPYPGTFQVCMQFGHRIVNGASGNVTATFLLAETPLDSVSTITRSGNVFQESTFGVASTGATLPNNVCGYFNWTDVSTRKVLLMFEQVVGGTVTANQVRMDRGATVAGRDLHVSVIPLTQQFPSAVLYGNYDPTLLSDAAATTAGKYVYEHGGSYNGGLAPTVTLDAGGGTLSSVEFSHFIPYQMQDGTWRMKFNARLAVSSTSRTSATFAIAGVTFFATNQAILGDSNASGSSGTTVGGGDTFVVAHSSASTTSYRVQGDVILSSKPTWAY